MDEPVKPNGLLAQFDAAYARVTEDRRDVYGAPEDTYRRISAMRAVVDECADPQLREILAMIVTKVARLVQTPERDIFKRPTIFSCPLCHPGPGPLRNRAICREAPHGRHARLRP